MNKKLSILLSLIGILVLGIGTSTYFSLNQKNETAQSGVFISEENKEEVSRKKSEGEKKKSKEKTSDSMTKNIKNLEKESLSKEKSKEVQAFNESVLSQEYYLEKVENGKLSYEKATEEGLKLLEKEVGNKNVSHYQVLHEGKLISVLTGNEEGTDT